ncbi:class I glutamine amidotransferase-like protein [Cadophora sp. MPI-SDFR-AT-0126]|nr:class I glutamine amidotransferase-like protein [Leotiomycetes sp. MPI-SDFR-AT-0126]
MKSFIVLILAGLAICQNSPLPTNIGILLFPGFQPLDVIGPLDVFNALSIQRHIHTFFISSSSSPVPFGAYTIPWFTPTGNFSSKLEGSFVPSYAFDNAPSMDVLIVPGGIGTRAPSPILDETIRFLKDVYPKLAYLMTVCTGSGIAARAGVLDGRSATTNKLAWAQTIALGPKVKWVAEARWVKDGNIWSSSGVSAGIDVAVAFVTEVYSEAAAVKVTNMLEYERHSNASDDPFAKLYGLTNENNSTNQK